MNNKTYYYSVARHIFSVNRPLDPAYEPFKTVVKGPTIFDVKIKMEHFHGKLGREILHQRENEVEISVGIHKNKFYFEFRLMGKRAAVLLTDIKYRQATLIVQEYPKYSIDSGLMVMYALSTATRSTLLFHSSVVMENGFAYMFLGKSGTGKSTHSKLWIDTIKGVALLNDDNPVVRAYPGGVIYVYGSPWSGKTPCYKNDYSALGGIVMLGQSKENRIIRINDEEAYTDIIMSVSGTRWDGRIQSGQHKTTRQLIHYIPLYHLWCRPDRDAARICHNEICVPRAIG